MKLVLFALNPQVSEIFDNFLRFRWFFTIPLYNELAGY
jgi:hypothetical protein